MEAESEELYEEIERLKIDTNKKSKELNALQTLQKFGVDVGGDFQIAEEIHRLSEKADALRAENAQMTFELKRLERKQHSDPVLTSVEAISLDEDELAAQILKAKRR
jgi:hypothetical protein